MYNQKLFINRCAKAWNADYEQAKIWINSQTHNKSLRINTLINDNDIYNKLIKIGISLKPINWAKNCYQITSGYENILNSDLHIKGNIILQDSSSFIPVILLDPRPKETILDLCAAPGGKTSHIASLSNNAAKIIANDSSKARFFRMKKYLKTLAVKADCTLYDGRYINKYLNDFTIDKILLDAPCSGEANLDINNPKLFNNWSLNKIKRLKRLQIKLLNAAYDLVKPGGLIIYSTCTIAPEENELVINNLLNKRPATLEPININIANRADSVLSWNDKKLNKSIEKTLRILPTESNEAFFVAVIKKPKNIIEDEYKYYA